MTIEKATVAGGCFWCMEHLFMRERGVVSVRSGYVGEEKREAVEILFDPEKITFLQILDLFWRHIDPLDTGGQFADRGSHYQTAIYYHDARQQRLAEKSKGKIQSIFGEPVATEILPATLFTAAEETHQKYCVKNKEAFERFDKGHRPLLEQRWRDKEISFSDDDLREMLTPIQFAVTQEEMTEPPFENEYWDHEEEGIYVDVITGEPLFSSADKFKSKSGWPSFTKPINNDSVTMHDDWQLGMHRTEIKSRSSGTHLGHLFEDGPQPTGLRYCINSAALRFIPKDLL